MRFIKGTIPVLIWGGVRGGISVALALSFPYGEERSIILTATYAVVLFTIIVQGLTLKTGHPPQRAVVARCADGH